MSKVFRIEKNKNYTVMSNYHFRDKNISLKAKGLLSQMLSLPEDWEYSINGLAAINKEGRDGINATLKELEKNGYIVRNQMRTEKGAFGNDGSLEPTVQPLARIRKLLLAVAERHIQKHPKFYTLAS